MFPCSYDGCGATFKKRWRLVEHVVKHTGEKPFTCNEDGCDKSFSRKSHLQRHAKTHLATKEFECQEEGCKMRFVATDTLKRHIKRVHQDRQFKCTWPDCHKSFKKHQQLKYHTCQHTGTLPHMCDHEGCEKAFSVPSKLRAHKKTHEGYTCDVTGCGVQVFKWSLMRKHKAEIHNRNFPCEHCGKLFKTSAKLRSHSKIHETQREVFQCPYQDCQRSYTRVSYLQQHINNYHQGARPFACAHDGCVKTFANKVSLVKHQVVHEPGYCKPPTNPKRKRSLASRLSGFPDAATRLKGGVICPSAKMAVEKTTAGSVRLSKQSNKHQEDSSSAIIGSECKDREQSQIVQLLFDGDSLEGGNATSSSDSEHVSERVSQCNSYYLQSQSVSLTERPDNKVVVLKDGTLSDTQSDQRTRIVSVIAELNEDRSDIWSAISEKVVDLLGKSTVIVDDKNGNTLLSAEDEFSKNCVLRDGDSSSTSELIPMAVLDSSGHSINSFACKSMAEMSPQVEV